MDDLVVEASAGLALVDWSRCTVPESIEHSGFLVRICKDDGLGKPDGEWKEQAASQNATSQPRAALEAATTYHCSVQLILTSGARARWSEPKAATLPVLQPPTHVSCALAAQRSVQLQWSHATAQACSVSGYEVQRVGHEGMEPFKLPSTNLEVNLGDDGTGRVAMARPDHLFEPGTSCSFRLRATSRFGPSNWVDAPALTLLSPPMPTPLTQPAALTEADVGLRVVFGRNEVTLSGEGSRSSEERRRVQWINGMPSQRSGVLRLVTAQVGGHVLLEQQGGKAAITKADVGRILYISNGAVRITAGKDNLIELHSNRDVDWSSLDGVPADLLVAGIEIADVEEAVGGTVKLVDGRTLFNPQATSQTL